MCLRMSHIVHCSVIYDTVNMEASRAEPTNGHGRRPMTLFGNAGNESPQTACDNPASRPMDTVTGIVSLLRVNVCQVDGVPEGGAVVPLFWNSRIGTGMKMIHA